VVTALNSSDALKDVKGTIVLAGAGKMGGAMLSAGWRGASMPSALR